MEPWHAWGTTILRVTLGVVYVMHGWLAAMVMGPEAVSGMIARIGYPESGARLLAWYLIAAHLAGGALLVLGFLTRAAALAQIPVMASALFLLHWRQGFFMTPEGGAEYAFVLLAATVALILLGPGAASIDHARALGPRIEMP
jgi:putative oxidoreductase